MAKQGAMRKIAAGLQFVGIERPRICTILDEA